MATKIPQNTTRNSKREQNQIGPNSCPPVQNDAKPISKGSKNISKMYTIV